MRSFTHHFSSLIGLRAILPAKPAPPPSILALGARRRLSKSRADSAIRAGIDRTPLGSVGWTGGLAEPPQCARLLGSRSLGARRGQADGQRVVSDGPARPGPCPQKMTRPSQLRL